MPGPLRGAFRSHTTLEAQCGKLPWQVRFGPAPVFSLLPIARPCGMISGDVSAATRRRICRGISVEGRGNGESMQSSGFHAAGCPGCLRDLSGSRSLRVDAARDDAGALLPNRLRRAPGRDRQDHIRLRRRQRNRPTPRRRAGDDLGSGLELELPQRFVAFGLAADGTGGKATINSCFYLLVKYYQLPTGLFVCPGDEGTTEFSLAKTAGVSGVPANLELADAWDFGPMATSCSFAYHMPFGPYALTTARDPNLAVAADRNPWIKSPAADPRAFSLFRPNLFGFVGGTAGR